MEAVTPAADRRVSEHGLKKDAIGFVDGLILFDSLTSLSLMIAFYNAFTGIACAVYDRHVLTRSAKNFGDFFGRRPETVDPDVAAGRKAGVAAVPEEAV